MKVIQLIDSLEIGGAERMCVNIANTFSANNISNAIVVTRPPYTLRNQLNSQTQLFTAHKNSRWDVFSFRQIHKFIRHYKPDVIHAHSTTILWACFLKILNPKVTLLWHDHFGNRSMASDNFIHRLLSFFLFGIITVNESLTQFHREKMFVPENRIQYIPNFPSLDMPSSVQKEPSTMIINANFIPVKDHLTLLKALALVKTRGIPFTLIMIGKEVDTAYTRQLKEFTEAHELTNSVVFKGQISTIEPFLAQASIGVLTSLSEGLPVSMLEYGMAGLAVVCTDVGQCSTVLGKGKFGWIIPPSNVEQLADTLEQLLKHPEQAQIKAKKFQYHVSENYSAGRFLQEYQLFLHSAH